MGLRLLWNFFGIFSNFFLGFRRGFSIFYTYGSLNIYYAISFTQLGTPHILIALLSLVISIYKILCIYQKLEL